MGGRQLRLNRVIQTDSQRQCSGRWSVRRRAEDAIRAGTLTRFRRIVAVVALLRPVPAPAMVAAARVRLNAITARTSQAAFAVNRRQVREGAVFQVGVDLLDVMPTSA